MAEPSRPLSLFIVRYKHNREVIDVPSRGETGEDAFQRYMIRLRSWGKNAKDYKFVSARRAQVPDEPEGG